MPYFDNRVVQVSRWHAHPVQGKEGFELWRGQPLQAGVVC